MTIITHTPAETQAIAQDLATQLKVDHNVIALTGDLGSGKTTFVQGIARALGITQPIKSPTFKFVSQYPIDPTKLYRHLVHADLYRLTGLDSAVISALREYWSDQQNLVVIEWAEKILGWLPSTTHYIQFSHLHESHRQIKIT